MGMKAFKGFNKDLTCRGFQYEQGKVFETDKADLCSSGFHACERPLDVFGYYAPGESVYHEVELDDVSDQRENDSKVCAKKIKVGAKLSIGDLVNAHIKFTKEHCTMEYTDPERATAGYAGAATAGEAGAATAGNRGAAAAGYAGAATAGEYGAATAGEYGAATAGNRGAAAAGNRGAATAGYAGAATAGYAGAATAGEYGAATAGYAGAATAGEYGAATSKGKSAVGENGLAVARGNDVRVKGGMGAVLVIAEENDHDCCLAAWKAGVVDGTALKPDTWYKLENGEFVEVAE